MMNDERTEPPNSIDAALQRYGVSDVKAVYESDLTPQGNYGRQWVVVTGDELLHFVVENGAAVLRERMPLADITGAHVEPLVSSGLLEIKVNGKRRALLHFSNACAESFGLLVQYLERRAQGRPSEPRTHSDQRRSCASCGRLLVDGQTFCPKCIKRGKVMRRLVGLAAPYWPQCLLIIGLLILGAAVDLMPPYLTKVLIDDVLRVGDLRAVETENGADAYQPPAWMAWVDSMIGLDFVSLEQHHGHWLLYLVIGLLALQLMRVVITIVSTRMITTVGTTLTRDIRSQMFRKLQDQGVRYHDTQSVGTLMTRIAQDTEELQNFIAQATQGFFMHILVLLGIGGVLFVMNWQLALFVLVPGPFVMAATYWFWNYIRPRLDRYWYSRWRINSMLNATLSGIRVVKAFAQEDQEIRRFEERNQDLYERRLSVDNSWHTFYPLVTLAFGLGGLLIWYVGGLRVLSSDPAVHITLGELMMFLGYIGMFYGPLSALTHISQWLTRFLTAAQRIFEILDTEPELKDPVDALVLKDVKGRLEFDNVTFGYDPHNPILHRVSFVLEPGEMLGIVGRSGAGKTTLINLLCRFYDVNDGAIRIDGVDVREVKRTDLRRQIGLVLQEPFLFRGTIFENIAYGRPHATREEVIQAAKAANAHDFIINLPESYDTCLGERGAGLSGGERQRVSIARAILCDPKILILDEATSSVDTETERRIQAALDVLVRNRTTIAIAHRLSTLKNADKIMVVENGQIVEFGAPVELLRQRGRYYDFVKTQMELAGADAMNDLATAELAATGGAR